MTLSFIIIVVPVVISFDPWGFVTISTHRHPSEVIYTTALYILNQLMWHLPDSSRPEVRGCDGHLLLAELLRDDRLTDPDWLVICVDAIRMTVYKNNETKVCEIIQQQCPMITNIDVVLSVTFNLFCLSLPRLFLTRSKLSWISGNGLFICSRASILPVRSTGCHSGIVFQELHR